MTARFNHRFSRRNFMQSLGASAALAPFLPILNASGATESVQPRRLILLFTPHAQFRPAWDPIGTPASFQYNTIMKPLEAHRAKINIITGMQMLVGPQGGAHIVGASELWTGSNSDGSYGNSTAASVDQVIANATKGATPYNSLELRTFCANAQTTIFAGPSQPLFGETNPQSALRNLFTQLSNTTSSRRKSVLDLVTKQLTSIQKKVPSADRAKIDAHLTAVRELETRLAAQGAAAAGPNLSLDANETTGFFAMVDLMAAAMTADLTRVGSIEFGQWGNDGNSYPDIGVNIGHHTMTHIFYGDSSKVDGNGNATSDPTQTADAQLIKIRVFYAQAVARLLDKLDSVPEGNGTMLDNTMIIWSSEMADYYWHSFGPSMPFLVAGGGNVFKGGRWLDYTKNPVYHNRLLTSACNFMGMTNVNSFGNMDGDATPGLHAGSGPLAGL